MKESEFEMSHVLFIFNDDWFFYKKMMIGKYVKRSEKRIARSRKVFEGFLMCSKLFLNFIFAELSWNSPTRIAAFRPCTNVLRKENEDIVIVVQDEACGVLTARRFKRPTDTSFYVLRNLAALHEDPQCIFLRLAFKLDKLDGVCSLADPVSTVRPLGGWDAGSSAKKRLPSFSEPR